MQDEYGDDCVVFRKLVRDKIPDIIKKEGKTPFAAELKGEAFKQALGRKILEEAGELFAQWTSGNADGVLNESADVLEITLAALKHYGFSLDDLVAVRSRRLEELGGFEKKLLLESTGSALDGGICFCETPTMVFSPTSKNRLIDLIDAELNRSEAAWIASAFYSPGITNLLVSSFERFMRCGGSLYILLSTMGNIVRPEYFTHLKQFVPGANLKVYHPPGLSFDQNPPHFHVKTYLFRHRAGTGSMLIGSSNFSEAGFTKNIEWNYFSQGEINLPFDGLPPFAAALNEFERCWSDESVEVTDTFIEGYRKRWEPVSAFKPSVQWEIIRDEKTEIFDEQRPWGSPGIEPNDAQKEALDNLASMRAQGLGKAAVIAATGVGKTFLAAFDFKASGSNRLLYIAHRGNILVQALNSYRVVSGDPSFGEILGRGDCLVNRDASVFAMIQTLSKTGQIKKFRPDDFDYVVMDEFHHSEAATYRRVLDYFKPSFLLGLTATPERMDGRDVLKHCDYNIGYEVRILEAVDRGWLVPFQYFAIYDETDYRRIRWRGTRYDEEELDNALIDDTRTEIVARNLKKFLPAKGKIKALAFCNSVAHAKFTAQQLTKNHGIEAVDLTGLASDDKRQEAIGRLQEEADSLQVICTVDVFNEGVDIPEVTHVLFIRPTQSFTVFLQQLGRGLRKTAGKEFLVAIDFVGNFRKAHVAPLALCGYTSAQEYAEDYLVSKKIQPWAQLPKGCHISRDLEVKRIWDEEIRKIIRDQLSPEDRLKALYLEIKTNLDGQAPSLMDFYAAGCDIDPYIFIRQFGNWLRTKKSCGNDLTHYEKWLLGSPGEAFLEHIEKELHSVKSYKMAVLKTLLALPGTEWDIADIARGFLDYFLKHTEKMFDYDDLYKSSAPRTFPLSKAIAKIKQMPLHFLSNTEKDYFILDKEAGTFRLKQEIHTYWQDDKYRSFIADRVEFALARYFRTRTQRQTVYFDPKVLERGFPLDAMLAKAVLGNEKLGPGESHRIRLILGKDRLDAHIKRSGNGKDYEIVYEPESKISEKLSAWLTPMPKKGDKAFHLYLDREGLRIEAVEAAVDLRGIVVKIPYAAKEDSGYTAQFRRLFAGEREAASWEMTFDKPGYSGEMDIEILDGNHFHAWTGRRYEDETRFPARIKAAATALHAEGFRGEYHMESRGQKALVKKSI
jgi:superfamily II DNA or RNA helicase/predicted house-cleaning noncanonical NTP pyrophosphatase (MazG superfamily)